MLWITIIAILALSAGYYLLKRLSFGTAKKATEKIFLGITGASALMIVLFVIYLLVTIFLNGKSHISWTFIFSAPTEGLTQGGIFPAIIGTALLVIIMTIIGVPVGTITAIYLTEYARENSLLSKFIRFAVNTLAGVPAIVFGLFGLGFFIGVVGKQMDKMEFDKKLDKMEVVFSSAGSPFSTDGKATPEEIKKVFLKDDGKYWAEQIDQSKILSEMHGDMGEITKTEAIDFYRERNKPHWGQPSLLWAALTMALLTLPVVIVSVEEALKAVPRELREASLALGATKLSTIIKIVLPGSVTGILTGAILAVSRGAGEVAPILFTGAAYYLPDLPHSVSSQFMELGYHLYILTTQSTNVELTKPLQYATTLVLLSLTFILNFSAIFLRSRLRTRSARY